MLGALLLTLLWAAEAGAIYVPVCKFNGVQKTKLVPEEKVQTAIDRGFVLGECPDPSNGRVMCKSKGGRDENLLVPDSKVQAALDKGIYTLGACPGTPGATPTPTPTPAPTPTPFPPGEGVNVTASVDGDAAPGASLTATAMIEILDGSTLQSISWTQTNSVPVTIQNGDTDTATVILPDESTYKDELLHVLAEPPITEEQLPPNVPLPEGEFPGGLQNRFQVVGINPFALEEAGAVGLMVEVTTTSGVYSDEVDIHAMIPWKVSTGIHNVPLLRPVLLHGRDHVDEDGDGVNDDTGADATVYNWALNPPAGSSATLSDAMTQSPWFTPDVEGQYTVAVTDTTRLPGNEVVNMLIYAGPWEGAITGQDMDGRPLADDCTGCHDGSYAPDQFTPWAQTGHAEIFTDNLDTSTHYGESCFSCHTVGYDPDVANGGADDAPDYPDFLAAGLLNNPGDNWTTVLADFPETARLANIQCENCHGPQNGGAHQDQPGEPRISLSSDVCGSCHGEPLRHARFQQWQLSGHANYELAIDEGDSGSCSRCHTANGFLTWLPVLTGEEPGDPLDEIFYCDDAVTGQCVGGANDGMACTDDDQCPPTWTADETHPQTCATCHDPHDIGTTTGIGTNANVRISDNTPPLLAGFRALGVGRGAMCMTCHNSRNGLRNDDTWDATVADEDTGRAPHGPTQTDLLMGQNAYFVSTGMRGSHSFVEDTCVNCHMVRTPPPDLLSYNLGGTNHTFFASTEICTGCHGDGFNAVGVQSAFDETLGGLQMLLGEMFLDLISNLIDSGKIIDLNGDATITDAADILEIEFGEYRGRHSLTVTFMDATTVGPVRVTDIDVLNGGTMAVEGQLYDFADERIPKAGWNYNLANNDGSRGVHNPDFIFAAMDSAIDQLIALWMAP